MKRLFFVLFLLSCSDGGSGAGSLGPLKAFEFIPDESDDWGEMMAEAYQDSLDQVRKDIEDSLAEDAADQRWIDSIAEDYHQRTGIDKRKKFIKHIKIRFRKPSFICLFFQNLHFHHFLKFTITFYISAPN